MTARRNGKPKAWLGDQAEALRAEAEEGSVLLRSLSGGKGGGEGQGVLGALGSVPGATAVASPGPADGRPEEEAPAALPDIAPDRARERFVSMRLPVALHDRLLSWCLSVLEETGERPAFSEAVRAAIDSLPATGACPPAYPRHSGRTRHVVATVPGSSYEALQRHLLRERLATGAAATLNGLVAGLLDAWLAGQSRPEG